MLLDSIADVNALLAKTKAKSGEDNAGYKFWSRVGNVMKLSYSYMLEYKWIHDRWVFTKEENAFLKRRNAYLQHKLSLYEAVQELKAAGNLEEVAARVDEFMNEVGPDAFKVQKSNTNGDGR